MRKCLSSKVETHLDKHTERTYRENHAGAENPQCAHKHDSSVSWNGSHLDYCETKQRHSHRDGELVHQSHVG